jgi:hydroxymethylglutaryl-CoA lyase
MAFPASVSLREVGPREGLQSIAAPLPLERKLELIDLLSQTGLRSIEVTSFVRADLVPQMADAPELVQRLPHREGVAYTALYLNPSGFARAEETGCLQNQGWIYTASSDIFLRANNNTSRAGVRESVPKWLAAFAAAGKQLYGVMISAAFGSNEEGSIAPAVTADAAGDLVRALKGHGAAPQEICLADTTGWGNPRSVTDLVKIMRAAHPGVKVSLHLHDTRGSGMANVYAGLECGVDIFETSVGGLGGCPFAKGAAGNVPTEDVANLCEQLGIRTGVDLAKLAEAALCAERLVGRELPGKFYKSWRALYGGAIRGSGHA